MTDSFMKKAIVTNGKTRIPQPFLIGRKRFTLTDRAMHKTRTGLLPCLGDQFGTLYPLCFCHIIFSRKFEKKLYGIFLRKSTDVATAQIAVGNTREIFEIISVTIGLVCVMQIANSVLARGTLDRFEDVRYDDFEFLDSRRFAGGLLHLGVAQFLRKPVPNGLLLLRGGNAPLLPKIAAGSKAVRILI